MKTGVCPKCAGKEIHVVEKTAREIAIALNSIQTADLNYYVCTNCGYVELFIRDKVDLGLIAKKYPKVG